MSTVINVPTEAYDTVLQREYHERLLSNIEEFTRTANIHPTFVWSKLSSYCSAEEIEWIKKSKTSSDYGMAYIGRSKSVPIEDRFMAIAGCYLRNYTDARVMTVQEVLAHLDSDSMPKCSVLLIPNFFLPANNGGSIPQWEISRLLGMLYNRVSSGQKTIVAISSVDEMKKAYGVPFFDHIMTHYTAINLG